jgi:ferredoxin-nitrite reductase
MTEMTGKRDEQIGAPGASAPGPLDTPGFDGLVCPGVFYAVHTGDGVLSRIRTPGGLLISAQCSLVAEIADRFAGGIVTVTNRANLQLRALADSLPNDVLDQLQQSGLAGAEPVVDHLRNIMASPTAGLDPGAIVDTRPLVIALDRHIATHPDLASLPAKFSVGFDGGERASIVPLPNDVLFRAYRDDLHEARFRIELRAVAGEGERTDLGFALRTDEVVAVAAAIAEAYLELLPGDGSKPRLRQLVAERSPEALRTMVLGRLPGLLVAGQPLPAARSSHVGAPIGVYAQADEGKAYIGIAPLVAGLSSAQLLTLGRLAAQYGCGRLHLSPWRNVVLPDVAVEHVEPLQAALESAGLPCRGPSLATGIVACAGSAGCGSGLADTVRDALALSARLGERVPASEPLNIHLSGCEKRCAQRRPADVTLLARPGPGERYDLYVRGDGSAESERLFLEALCPADALDAVDRLVAGRQDGAAGYSG